MLSYTTFFNVLTPPHHSCIVEPSRMLRLEGDCMKRITSYREMPPDFSGRIKNLRERLALSQSRLGELLGVTAMTISRWESGQSQPPLELWQRIVQAEAT